MQLSDEQIKESANMQGSLDEDLVDGMPDYLPPSFQRTSGSRPTDEENAKRIISNQFTYIPPKEKKVEKCMKLANVPMMNGSSTLIHAKRRCRHTRCVQ